MITSDFHGATFVVLFPTDKFYLNGECVSHYHVLTESGGAAAWPENNLIFMCIEISDALSDEEREAVLWHEWQHIQDKDMVFYNERMSEYRADAVAVDKVGVKALIDALRKTTSVLSNNSMFPAWTRQACEESMSDRLELLLG